MYQSSDELDTDTEFEPVEDMTIETRSRCKIFVYFYRLFCKIHVCLSIFVYFTPMNFKNLY